MSAREGKAFIPDFSAYPDLVVILLGMRVRTLYGLKTLMGFKSPIEKAGEACPDGLLHADNNIVYSLFPPHIGMRWYWRDLASLEVWTKSEPHRAWWMEFIRNTHGTGIWHETYHMRGGMEAIYNDVRAPVGLANFLPMLPARGSIASRQKVRAAEDLNALPLENMPDAPHS